MFIVIDGIDGSGKGTQLNQLVTRLESEGKRVMTLDFPRYEEPSSFFVQKYLNGGYGQDVSAKASSLFYALDRFDATRGREKEFANHDFILSNRYVSASMIHQGGKIFDRQKRAEFLSWLHELEFEILGIPQPDLVLFLDVPPKTSQRLVETKDDRAYIQGDENKDIHEKDEHHLVNAYNCCLELVEMHENWKRIECLDEKGNMRTIDEISDLIYSVICTDNSE